MTFFGGSVLSNDNSFLLLDANWYMRQPIAEARRSPFVGDDDRNFRSAQVFIHSGDYAKALEFLKPLAEADPLQFATHLEIVRCHAGLGQKQETIDAIEKLARCGWGHRATIASLPEFQRVAEDPTVKKALDGIPDEASPYVSSQAFRRSYAWSVNGGRYTRPNLGRNFVLSTVLAVTRNNGTTLDEALEYLRNAAAADFTNPQGSFYFALTGDVRTTARQPGFEAAIDGLREKGFEVAGAMLGDQAIPWPTSFSRILPGAIVDNMTSLGGKMKGNHHTPATNFLKWGAAGSSGTVVEPFSLQAKFAHPMIFVHYARGCSMAEAYYQSVHSPFQLLIVGDALCQPWAQPVSFDLVGLKPGETARGVIRVELKTDDASKIDHFELYLDGVRSNVIPEGERFSFDADKIPDGFHELRIVAIAKGPLETQARVILPFVIDHDGGTVTLEAEKTILPHHEEIEITAQSPNATGEITIYQNSRAVGTISKSGESVRIAGSLLGAGTSHLIGRATIEGQVVQSEPIAVTVQ
jgi:hypothetical protein